MDSINFDLTMLAKEFELKILSIVISLEGELGLMGREIWPISIR